MLAAPILAKGLGNLRILILPHRREIDQHGTLLQGCREGEIRHLQKHHRDAHPRKVKDRNGQHPVPQHENVPCCIR